MWPAIWFLPGVPRTPVNELDGDEGGWLGANPNEDRALESTSPTRASNSTLWHAGVDVTAGYHVYGFRFIPGHSITAFFDGRQVWQVSGIERHHHHRGAI